MEWEWEEDARVGLVNIPCDGCLASAGGLEAIVKHPLASGWTAHWWSQVQARMCLDR